MNSLPSLNTIPMETIDSWETVNSQVEQLPTSPHQSRFSPLNEADKSQEKPSSVELSPEEDSMLDYLIDSAIESIQKDGLINEDDRLKLSLPNG